MSGWLPELWAYEMARAETLYWIFQPSRHQPIWPTAGEAPTRFGSYVAYYRGAIEAEDGRQGTLPL